MNEPRPWLPCSGWASMIAIADRSLRPVIDAAASDLSIVL
jgi:hypothetical protein